MKYDGGGVTHSATNNVLLYLSYFGLYFDRFPLRSQRMQCNDNLNVILLRRKIALRIMHSRRLTMTQLRCVTTLEKALSLMANKKHKYAEPTESIVAMATCKLA